MANLTESPNWENGIYQFETTDPVLGGPDGIDNLQAKQLGNRTLYLKQHLDALEAGSGDQATRVYVRSQINELDAKQSVRAATTTNISLSGVLTVDGVSLLVGNRVLVKNQTSASQNGIYVVSGSAWSRSADADETAEVTPGLSVYVEEGIKQGKSNWRVTTPSPIVLGTTLITFEAVTAGFQFNALKIVELSALTVNLSTDDAGSVVVITGSGGGTLVLPQASSVMQGETLCVRCNNTDLSTNTLKAFGTDTIGGATGGGVNSAVLGSVDCISLVSDGVSKWEAFSESTSAFLSKQFKSGQQLGASGYQKLPGGMVIQFGSGVSNSSGKSDVVFPIAFPNGCSSLTASGSGASTANNVSLTTGSVTKNGFSAYTTQGVSGQVGSATSLAFNWTAIGY